MVRAGRAITRPAVMNGLSWIGGCRKAEPERPLLKPRLERRRRRRRILLNEPATERRHPVESTQWELYQWHRSMGTLGMYFMMFPEP